MASFKEGLTSKIGANLSDSERDEILSCRDLLAFWMPLSLLIKKGVDQIRKQKVDDTMEKLLKVLEDEYFSHGLIKSFFITAFDPFNRLRAGLEDRSRSYEDLHQRIDDLLKESNPGRRPLSEKFRNTQIIVFLNSLFTPKNPPVFGDEDKVGT